MANLQTNIILDDIFAEAQRVLSLESQALKTLALHLNDEFTKAIECLHKIKGRIIVSGMGKSGHIGRKIAATLASTGSTAYFVHPGEASHGDMGMITSDDAVIALSYSGETVELADIIAYTKRFEVPLIAITSKPESALCRAADYQLLLPRVEEACPYQLAPTTSTTMMLALGDAIALCLMNKKGFSPEAFRVFHPGGALGKKLLKVSDLMHKEDEMPLVHQTTSMRDAILVMTEKRLGCVGVVNDARKLVGIITDGDLRRHFDANLIEQRAIDVMTPHPKVITSDALAVEATRIMSKNGIGALFVVDQDIAGIIHLHDCLKAGLA